DGAKLWLQTGNLYAQAGQLYLAVNAWQTVVQDHQQKPEAPLALWSIASHLENAVELTKASAAYHQYATQFASEEKASAAVMRACILYVALENDLAIDTCLAAAGKYPKEVTNLFDRIIATLERD